MSQEYRVAVVGAAGFAGVELVRILLAHPRFRLEAITSDALAGAPLAQAYPAFADVSDLRFQSNAEAELTDFDLVFLAVPHKAALSVAPGLIEAGVSVVDLSADFRLKDPLIYETWYATPHTAVDLLAHAAFGLPEICGDELAAAARDFSAGTAALVACAGCYPTATSLAAYPAIAQGWVAQTPIVVNAISGVTGAGKSATERTHFCFANENVEAYGVGSHRHTPEIEQILGRPGGVIFTPHLAPLNRGLLSTVVLPLAADASPSSEEVREAYANFYGESPLVSVMETGRWPKTSSVAGTNRAHVGVGLSSDGSAIIAVGAIDNLGKGAAGQAVQCANILCGFDQTCGLAQPALPI